MDIIKGICSGVSSLFATNTGAKIAVTAIAATAVATIGYQCFVRQQARALRERVAVAKPPRPEMAPSRFFSSKTCQVSYAPSPSEVSLKEGDLPAIDQQLKEAITSYMKGEIDTIPINGENYREVLRAIKIIDLELDRTPGSRKGFKFSTYELRTRCLAVSQGSMHTFEAYTKSIDPKYFNNPFSLAAKEYASHPENYVPERVRLQSVVLQKYVIDAFAMSNRFKHKQPTIYALSGNTGVGKSHAAKTDPAFMQGNNENGEASGALNLDVVKALLRKDVDGVTNQQVHVEGFVLGSRIGDELRKRATKATLVIDERLGTTEYVGGVVDAAKNSRRPLCIKDIDAPPILSALRVLARDVKKDPCVPLGPITAGLKVIRRDRKAVIDLVVASPNVKSYELHVTDESGRTGLAARKVPATNSAPARLEIVDRDLFDYALSGEAAAEGEIAALKGVKITAGLCARFEACGVDAEALSKFSGQTVEDALLAHSRTLPRWKVGAS